MAEDQPLKRGIERFMASSDAEDSRLDVYLAALQLRILPLLDLALLQTVGHKRLWLTSDEEWRQVMDAFLPALCEAAAQRQMNEHNDTLRRPDTDQAAGRTSRPH